MNAGERWRFATENALVWGSLGMLAGGSASWVLFRSVAVRLSVAALGCGFGLGRSVVDARYLFGYDVPASGITYTATEGAGPTKQE